MSTIWDYSTLLVRYPSCDALYWECRYGLLAVPVAVFVGWPRPGRSFGRCMGQAFVAAMALLVPLHLCRGFQVRVCQGLLALAGPSPFV